jgi:hypothetical protein
MYFFKNGTGWCIRHNPEKKETITRRPQAPIFRKLQAASSKRQASSAKLFKRQAASFPTQVTSVKLQAASYKLRDP